MELLIKQLKDHDPETYCHSHRVAKLALVLTQEIGLSCLEQKTIHTGALLHDIGKLHIPGETLNKEQKLTLEEWRLMQKHPIFGYELTKKYFDTSEIPYMILYHHERYDGTGYPFGLPNKEIPLGAQIIAVADSFDAMTFRRSYNRAKSRETAIRELEEQKDILYSAVLINAFVKALNQKAEKFSIEIYG